MSVGGTFLKNILVFSKVCQMLFLYLFFKCFGWCDKHPMAFWKSYPILWLASCIL